MKSLLLSFSIAVGSLLCLPAFAQTPSPVTATCKDGTAYSGTTRSGACRGHGGVQAFGAAAASPAPAQTTPAPTATTRAPSTPAAIAPGGGPGQVWVNTASKVYHCQGDRYYGKTKKGAYMTEAAAKSAGDRPSGGKSCS